MCFLCPKNLKRKFVIFDAIEKWIKELLDIEHYKNDAVDALYSRDNLPKYLLIQIEGGLLLSRLYHDFAYIEIVKQFIKNRLKFLFNQSIY